MHREAGFSLVEVTVAAVVLSAGILGVAGSALAARRLADVGDAQARAAELVGSVVARAAADPCRAAASSRSDGRIQVAGSVTTAAPLRILTVQVTIPDGARSVRRQWRGALLCPEELP